MTRVRIPYEASLGACFGLWFASCASAAPDAPAASGAVASVVVTAQTLHVETLIDRKVYTVSADLQTLAGTVIDVLAVVPSIDVDPDGNVSLRGDGNVTILVDGRPIAQLAGETAADALQQIPAQDIQRIEVITNPPAQYKAEGSGGIINIITRHGRRSGLSGVAQASLGTDHRAFAGVSGSYGAGPLAWNAAASLRRDTRERLVDSAQASVDALSGEHLVSSHTLDEQLRRRLPRLKLGVDFSPDAQHTLGVLVVRGERDGERSFLQQDRSSLADGEPLSASQRRSVGQEWSLDSSEELSWSQRFDRKGESLDAALQHTAFREREQYRYTNDYTLPQAPPGRDSLSLGTDRASTELSIDYVRPLSRGRALKLGYDGQQDDDANDNGGALQDPLTGAWVVNPDLTNHFRYRQRVHAAYAMVQASHGAWSAQGGVRLEYTAIDTNQLSGDLVSHRHDARLYPSVHLDRTLTSTTTLSLSASRRVSRPDPGALNPLVDHQDTHNLRAGNPALRPQDTRSYEIGYAVETPRRAYTLTGYLRLNRDSVTDLSQAIAPDVLLTTRTNLPRSRASGLEFAATGHLTPAFGYSVSGNAFYSQIDGTALGAAGLASTTGLNAKANLDYHATALDTLQLSVTRSDRRLTAQGYIGAVSQLNLGFRHQLRPALYAVATLNDACNSQRFRRVVETATWRDSYQRHWLGRVVFVGLTYNFGTPKKTQAAAASIDEES